VSVFESFLRVQKLKVLCVCLGDPWEVHLKTQGSICVLEGSVGSQYKI